MFVRYFSRLTPRTDLAAVWARRILRSSPVAFALLDGGLRGPAQITGGTVFQKGQWLGDQLQWRAHGRLPGNGRL